MNVSDRSDELIVVVIRVVCSVSVRVIVKGCVIVIVM